MSPGIEVIDQKIKTKGKTQTVTMTLSKQSDEDLVHLIKDGSEAAFAELTKRYMKKSWAIAVRIVGDYETAKDITQDVFTKIYSTIHSFKEGSKFFSWYYRILMNHCINYKRRKKIVQIFNFTEYFRSDDRRETDENLIKDENNTDGNDTGSAVRAAINQLSPKHREVVILFDLEGFPQEEIADILGISLGTVRSRLHYARNNLKKILKKYL